MWGLEQIETLFCIQKPQRETSISDANHAVLHAQNDRWGQPPIETSNSCAKGADLDAQNHTWGLEPL